MNVFLRHLLYALKINRRRYRSALVVVMLFALGIGATTTMFNVLYDVVLRPLPFRDPQRLVLVSGAASPPTGSRLGWWGQASAFHSLCLFSAGAVNLSEGDRPERISAAAVSPSFFSVVSGFLFGILPTDPGTMVGAVLLLVLAAVAASPLPALAASRVEPASVLRYE
jgi:hypothetical protein